MMLTRATNTLVHAGADTILVTSDDIHRHNNKTTPFVDQNQTYTSHASHQVFLREYELDLTGGLSPPGGCSTAPMAACRHGPTSRRRPSQCSASS